MTTGPRLGIVSISPSDSSWRRASRTDVRLTPVSSHSSRSMRRSPGAKNWLRMDSRRRSTVFSRSVSRARLTPERGRIPAWSRPHATPLPGNSVRFAGLHCATSASGATSPAAFRPGISRCSRPSRLPTPALGAPGSRARRAARRSAAPCPGAAPRGPMEAARVPMPATSSSSWSCSTTSCGEPAIRQRFQRKSQSSDRIRSRLLSRIEEGLNRAPGVRRPVAHHVDEERLVVPPGGLHGRSDVHLAQYPPVPSRVGAGVPDATAHALVLRYPLSQLGRGLAPRHRLEIQLRGDLRRPFGGYRHPEGRMRLLPGPWHHAQPVHLAIPYPARVILEALAARPRHTRRRKLVVLAGMAEEILRERLPDDFEAFREHRSRAFRTAADPPRG